MQAVTVTAEGGEGGFWATAAPIIPHPLEFFFGLACFAILYFVVAKAVVPRLEQIYAERTAAIEGGMNKAEEAQAAGPGRARAVPGAARRGPRRGRRASVRTPRPRARRSSPRCASTRRPRPPASPRPRTSRSRPSASRRSSRCAREVGPHLDRPREPHRRRVAARRDPSEGHRRALPRRARVGRRRP